MDNKLFQTSKRQAAYQKFEDQTFHQFFVAELTKLYSLEKELSNVAILKKNKILALEMTPYHFLHQETLMKILRLEQVFMLIDERPKTAQVKVTRMHDQLFNQLRSIPAQKKFGLAMLRILHYKLPIYRFLNVFAQTMNRTDIVELLQRTFDNDQMLIKSITRALMKRDL